MIKDLVDIIRKENCQDCNLYKTAQAVCLIGAGPCPCSIMIIGEAPGLRKYDINKPFAGKAGKILDVILETADLTRDDVYITNVVHCRPPDNRTPTMSEMRTCRKYLLEEIKYVKPEIIISLGNVALKGLYDTNLISISKERGKILEIVLHNRKIKVIPTYHPAAALRNKYFANILYEDLTRGLSKINAGDEIDPKGTYKHIKNPSQKLIDKLVKAKRIAIDLETTSLDYTDKKEEIVTINLSIKSGKSYVFSVNKLDLIKDILENKELVIGHNIKFDLKWLLRYCIEINFPIFDTMVAKHLLDENYPDKDLKHLARVELGMMELTELAKKMEQHRKKKTIPTIEEYTQYGGGDVDATYRLYKLYRNQLKEEGLLDLMNIEMEVLKSLTYMEFFGFKIDKEALKKLSKEYLQRIEKAKLKIGRMIGDINLNSPKQLGEVLYEKMKLPIINKTAKGAPSCNEATLKELLEITHNKNKETLEALLEYRTLAKLQSVYLEGLIKNNLLKDDSKVHCDFKITGTKTGRLSCTEPNLQNIPRDGDIKKMFVSSFKDGYLIQVDYSQMELRILSHYANDKKLVEAFVQGRDIHTETTAKCLHKKYEEVTKDERKIIGKRVNFGIVYLISPKGLSERLACSEKTAKGYIDSWFNEFDGVKKWMRRKREEIIRTGKSYSFNGRLRRLYGVDPATSEGREAIRQGVNSPIQGGAGDITKYNMTRLDKILRESTMKSRVISNVHDAVIVDCPNKKEVKQCIKLINKLFKEPQVPLRVPLEFEIKVGKNWNDMKEIRNGKEE